MAYVEWLRVRNGLRIIAIILGSLLLLGVTLRSIPGLNPLEGQIDQLKSSPNARISVAAISGGTKTVVDDPTDNVHAVVIDYGFGRKSYDIGPIKGNTTSINLGDRNHPQQLQIAGAERVNDTPLQTDVMPFAIAMLVGGMIAAFMLSGPLGNEYEHLAITWTKPIGRNRLALQLCGVDAVGILGAMLLTLIAAIIVVALFIPLQLQFASNVNWTGIALCFLTPFAWHAFVTAATTSLKRYVRAGWFFGILYMGGFVVPGLAAIRFGDSAPGIVAHAVFQFLAFFDPINYLQISSDAATAASVARSVTGIEILIALTVAYIVASLVQWRRLEA